MKSLAYTVFAAAISMAAPALLASEVELGDSKLVAVMAPGKSIRCVAQGDTPETSLADRLEPLSVGNLRFWMDPCHWETSEALHDQMTQVAHLRSTSIMCAGMSPVDPAMPHARPEGYAQSLVLQGYTDVEEQDAILIEGADIRVHSFRAQTPDHFARPNERYLHRAVFNVKRESTDLITCAGLEADFASNTKFVDQLLSSFTQH